MSAGEGLESAKLKYKRNALAVKAELLNRLDKYIVGLIHEDKLEGEIESADMIRELIELIIIKLDSMLIDKSQMEHPKSHTCVATHEPSHDTERQSP